MNRAKILLTCGLAFLASCQQAHDHSHDEQEFPTVALTAYSENIELFVDFEPMVAGKTTTMMVHVSLMNERFIPLENGTINAVFSMDGKETKSSSNKPETPGIFEMELDPELSGEGNLTFEVQTPSFTDMIRFENITVFPDLITASRYKNPSNSGDEITYLKNQAWNIEFSNTSVRRESFREILKTSGQVLPAPGDETVITANSNGAVLFATNKTVIGSELKTGDHLFTISSANLTQDNPDVYFNETKAKYELSKAEFQRAEVLVKDRIISQKEYLQAKMEYENMESIFEAVSRNYSRSGQKISANSSGFLKNLMVTEGQYVEAGFPLAVVSKNKKVLLQANVSQKYYNKLPGISAANFRIISEDKVFDSERMNGKVVSYGKSASANSSFIPITFEIDNIGNIIPGAIAEVYLKSSPIPDALVIPVSALMEELGNFYVFVQTGGESFQKREIKLGGNDGIQVHILSGLKENERVVTKGAYAIKLASASGAIPEHGHSH